MNNKASYKDIWKTLLWSSKLGFKISPFFYSLKFMVWLIRPIVPVLQALIYSLILGELFYILSNGIGEMTNNLWNYILIGIVLSLINTLKELIDDYQRVRFGFLFTEKVFNMYLSRLGNLDFYYHENPDFLKTKERIRDVLDWRGITVLNRIPHLLGNLIGIITVVGIFISINPLFLFLLIIPMLLNGYVNKKFGENVYYIWEWGGEENTEAINAYNSLEDKNVIAEAKIYGFARYIANKFSTHTRKYSKRVVKETNTKTLYLALSIIVEKIIFVGIQIWLVLRVVSGAISIEAYSFYLQNIDTVNKEFDSLQDNFTSLLENLRFMNDFKTFLEMEDYVKKPTNGVKMENMPPSIEFKNVSFSYPIVGDTILKNVSFRINSGEKVALVGKNGAGKTTLIKLIARFYDPVSGNILINDTDLKKIDLDSFYKLWGILFQSFARYWFTLRENIGIGNISKITDLDALKDAIQKSGIDEFIDKLKNGYETMLSPEFKDGTDLSGGQWQKVGIARGFFSNPKLIILDEPTSALDSIAEQEIFNNIQKISKDTTMIIVSHRFATVRNADRIIVLDDGEIKENGTHDELIQNKGLYFEMFTTQARGYK